MAINHIFPDQSIFLGSILQSGSTTFTTGTGNVTLNGNTTVSGIGTLNVSGGLTTLSAGLSSSGGAISLTGNGASFFTTTAGNLSLDAYSILNLGTSTATSIHLGTSGITTTITGGLTQLSGVYSFTGTGASSVSTSSGALTLTSAAAGTWDSANGTIKTGLLDRSTSGTLQIGTSTATGITIGKTGVTTANAGHLSIDGYTIDLSAGASRGSMLSYNGTSFVPLFDNFNVKDFGAVGNGTTDDTTAIQAAVTAAAVAGGTVFFPFPGRYKITSQILISSIYPVNLVGQMYGFTDGSSSATGSFIMPGANFSSTSMFRYQAPGGSHGTHGAGMVRGLAFYDGYNAGASFPAQYVGNYTMLAALDLTDFNLGSVQDCMFHTLNGGAIRAQFMVMGSINNIEVRYCGTVSQPAVSFEGTSTSIVVQSTSLTNSRLEVNYGTYLSLDAYTTEVKVSNVGMEADTVNGSPLSGSNVTMVNNAGNQNMFSNIHLNRNNTTQWVDSGARTQVSNLIISDNGSKTATAPSMTVGGSESEYHNIQVRGATSSTVAQVQITGTYCRFFGIDVAFCGGVSVATGSLNQLFGVNAFNIASGSGAAVIDISAQYTILSGAIVVSPPVNEHGIRVTGALIDTSVSNCIVYGTSGTASSYRDENSSNTTIWIGNSSKSSTTNFSATATAYIARGNNWGGVENETVAGLLVASNHLKVDGYTINLSSGATSGQVLSYNGSNFVASSVGASGTVTSIATAPRLTGGTITTSGTLDLATSGVVPATYYLNDAYLTFDAYGRATSSGDNIFYVNVKTFGAVGDGSTNDTAAIQAAINAAQNPTGGASGTGGGVVYFPIGRYKISSTLTLTNIPVSFVGASFYTTEIYASSSINAIFQFTDAYQNQYFQFKNLWLNGNFNANYGIISATIDHSIFDTLLIQQTNTAISIGSGWDNDIVQCEISYNSNDGIRLTNGNANNIVNIFNTKVFQNSGTGIWSTGGAGLNITGCTIENNLVCGINLQLLSNAARIVGNYFEGNGTTGKVYTSPLSKTVKADIIINGSTNDGYLNYAYPCSGVTISNNTANNSTANSFIYLVAATGINIENNYVSTSGTRPLIGSTAFGSAAAQIYDLNASGNTYGGVFLSLDDATTQYVSTYNTADWFVDSVSKKNYFSQIPSANSVVVNNSNPTTLTLSTTTYNGDPAWEFSATSGSTNVMGQSFNLANYPELASQTVCFSAWVKVASASTEGVALYATGPGYNSNSFIGDTNWHLFQTTVVLPSSGTVVFGFEKFGAASKAYISRPCLTLVGSPRQQFFNQVLPSNSQTGWLNVKDFGATGNGTTDDTVAFSAALSIALSGNSTIYIPPGSYVISSSLQLRNNGVHVIGAGVGATNIIFAPTADGYLFNVTGNGNEIAGCSIEKLTISSSDTSHKKTALLIDDADQFYCQDVWIGASSTWSDTSFSSVGFRIRGRQSGTYSRIRSFSDIPLQISSNPDITTVVNNDHLHISDTYLVANSSNPNFLIDDSVLITNLTIDGDNAWNLGKYGLYWKTTVSNGNDNNNVRISNVRYERPVAVDGYGIYIERSGSSLPLQGIMLENLYLSPSNNGIYLQNSLNATLSNVVSACSDGYTALSLSGVSELLLLNCLITNGGAVNTGGLTLIWGMPILRTGGDPQNIPSTAYYGSSSQANLGMSLGTTLVSTPTGLDSPGAQLNLGITSATSVRIGQPAIQTALVSNLLVFGDNTTSARTVIGGFQPGTGTTGTITFTGATGGNSDGATYDGYTGSAVTVRAGTGGGGSGSRNPGNGAITSILGGNANSGGSGNANGGNVVIDGGIPSGTGTGGLLLLGNGTATSSITLGHSGMPSGITMVTGGGGLTVTGPFVQQSGSFTMTGNSQSSITTSAGSLVLDGYANVNVGVTTATGVVIGRAGQLITIPGGTIRALTPGAGGGNGVNLQFGPAQGGAANGSGFPAGNGGTTTISSGGGGAGDGSNAPGNSSNLLLSVGAPGATGAFGGGGNSGSIVFNVPAPTGTGTSGQYSFQFGGSNKAVFVSNGVFAPGSTNTGGLGNSSTVWGTLFVTTTSTNTIDTLTSTTLTIGNSTASGIIIGKPGITTVLDVNNINLGPGTGTTQIQILGSVQGAADTNGAGLLIASAGGGPASATGGGTAGALVVRGATGGNGTGALNPGTGGAASFAGGPGGTGGTGNSNGGSVSVDSGQGQGTGLPGVVNIGTSNATTINVGNSNGTTYLAGSTASGTGAVRSYNKLYVVNTVLATSGTQLVNSPNFYLQGAYWNGSSSAAYYGSLTLQMTGTAPAGYLQFLLGQPSPSEVGRIDSTGTFKTLAGGGLDTSSSGALNIGGTTATSIAVGHSGVTTTITGSFVQQTGSFLLTATSNSGITSTAGSINYDAYGTASLGVTSAQFVNIGRTGVTTTITGFSNALLRQATASNTQLTTTSPTTIATYTTAQAGNYMVMLYYRVATATTVTTITVSWTDSAGAQSTTIINAQSMVVGSYTLAPVFVNATNATAISVSATAGTANQLFVSAGITSV